MLLRARCQVGDDVGDRLAPVRPHQVDIAALGGRRARILREPAEVELGGLARNRADTRRIQLQLPEIPVMVQRLAVQQRLQYAHGFDRARIARARRQLLAGHVGGDDVHRQPTSEDAVDRGDLARQLRRPHLADPHGHQEAHALQHRRDRRGEGGGVDAQLVARGQQDIVEAASFGLQDDVSAVLPARLQRRVGHAEELIVVVAECGEPGDFAGRQGLGHGSGSPWAATRTSYHSARVQVGV